VHNIENSIFLYSIEKNIKNHYPIKEILNLKMTFKIKYINYRLTIILVFNSYYLVIISDVPTIKIK